MPVGWFAIPTRTCTIFGRRHDTLARVDNVFIASPSRLSTRRDALSDSVSRLDSDGVRCWTACLARRERFSKNSSKDVAMVISHVGRPLVRIVLCVRRVVATVRRDERRPR